MGLFTQPPQPQETNAAFGTAGLTSNRAYHYDVGVEREFTEHIDASLDGFYKQLDNLVEQGLGNTGSGHGLSAPRRSSATSPTSASSAGSRTRSRAATRRTTPGAPLRIFQYDETHILTVLGSYRLGRGWELGMRYRLSSGYMYTPQTATASTTRTSARTCRSRRTRPTTRACRSSTRSTCASTRRGSFPGAACKRPASSRYLDVLNIYNQGNVDGISYDYNYTHTAHGERPAHHPQPRA